MKGDMILIQLVTRLLSMARMANTQAFWQKSSTRHQEKEKTVNGDTPKSQ